MPGENTSQFGFFDLKDEKLKLVLEQLIPESRQNDSDIVQRSKFGSSFGYRAKNGWIYFIREDEQFTTDLASIPKSLNFFEVTFGKHSLAAIFHDWLLQGRNSNPKEYDPEIKSADIRLQETDAPQGELPSKEATSLYPKGSEVRQSRWEHDALFKEALLLSGVKRWRVMLMWSAVQLHSRLRRHSKKVRSYCLLWCFYGLAAWLTIAFAIHQLLTAQRYLLALQLLMFSL